MKCRECGANMCLDDKDKAIARCVFWQIGKRIWSLQKDHSRCC